MPKINFDSKLIRVWVFIQKNVFLVLVPKIGRYLNNYLFKTRDLLVLFQVFRFHGWKFSAVLILLPKLRRKYGILKYVRIQFLKNSYFIFRRSIDLPIHLSLFILSHCHSTLGTRYVALPPPQHFSSRSLNLTLPPYF